MKERFLDLRARVQNYRSGKFAYCWIAEVNMPTLCVDFVKEDGWIVGDRYHLEVNDDCDLLMLDAWLKAKDGGRGTFEVDGAVKVAKQTENMRLRVCIDSTLKHGGRGYNALVTDLSREGLGIMSNVEVIRGERAEIELCLGRDTLTVVGKSIYCRRNFTFPWAYRMGFAVPQLDQLIDPDEGNLRKAVPRKANRKAA